MHVVTGGAGFIGSAFVAKLNALGIDDVVIVDELGSDSKWKNLRGKRYAEFLHKTRFLDLVHRRALPFRPTAIIHLGAISTTTERNVDLLYENNVRYTQDLALFALEVGARFVYASSAATYGDGSLGYTDDETRLDPLMPLNPYGYSKHRFDQWAVSRGILKDIVGIKFFNVYGPNEYHKAGQHSVVLQAYQQIQSQGLVKLFKSYRSDFADGEQQRDFVYVKDCAEVMTKLLTERSVNGLFNLGTGEARSWNALATACFKALGKEPRIEYIEMPDNIRTQYQYFTQADMTKLENSGCAVPFHSLEDGVRDYVVNYLDRGMSYL